MRHWPRWLRGALLVVGFILLGNALNFLAPRLFGPGNSPMASQPALFLWAWERPEDLRFLQPDDAGIAVLLAHLFIENAAPPSLERRKQPLLLTPKTPLMAVVRIVSRNLDGNPAQADQAAAELMRVFGDSKLVAVQLDFDATSSERAFYSMILSRLRNQLPKRVPITMTALASWCQGDRWLGGLPVDEAIPMMFRMGPDAAEIRRVLAQGEGFEEPLCRTTLGLSTDEPLTLPRHWEGRIYLFNPKPWTKQAYDAALKELR